MLKTTKVIISTGFVKTIIQNKAIIIILKLSIILKIKIKLNLLLTKALFIGSQIFIIKNTRHPTIIVTIFK